MPTEEFFAWVDADGIDKASPHPYLIFEPIVGALIIADDFEVANDETAREFKITQKDALSLAIQLLIFARENR